MALIGCSADHADDLEDYLNVSRTMALLSLILFVWTRTLHAHHSVAASYDTSQTITVTGVITSVEWRNPHVTMHFAVKNGDGSVTDWRLEMRGPNALSAAGIDLAPLVLGDQPHRILIFSGAATTSGYNSQASCSLHGRKPRLV